LETKLLISLRIRYADLQVYDDMRHEIFNEPARRKVLNDVLDWMEVRLGV